MLQYGLGDPAAAHHTRQFVCPLGPLQIFDAGGRAAGAFGFLHPEMMVGEAGYLRQVGDAEDLAAFGQLPQFSADGLRGAAADAVRNEIGQNGSQRPH